LLIGGLGLFSVRVADARAFRDILSAISTLVDEGTFYITEEGIRLRAMDPSRVAMVDFAMNKSAFDEYVSSGELKMCIDIGELLKLLRRAGRESVELFLDEETGQLKVTIRGKYTRTFSMPTLEASEEEVPTPRITFNVKATLTTDGLHQALEDVSLVSEHVRIEAEGDRIVMNAKGELMGVNIELDKGSDALISLEVKEPSRATFSLSYLSEIVKAAASTSDVVTMEFSTDMPIRLDFKQQYDGKLIYYLAPRIEVE